MRPTTRGELALAIAASGASCSVPIADPLALRDLAAAPESSVDIAMARVVEGRSPTTSGTFCWPKDDGTERRMTYLDPFDEVIYRALVGRFVQQIEATIDRGRVLAARPLTSRPFWRLENFSVGARARTELATAYLDKPDVAVMATADVRRHFYRVSGALVRDRLDAIPGSDSAKRALVRWLDDLEPRSGISGLPVGHEPSSLLGNFVLGPCDAFMAQLSVEWLRWMDDTWIFAASTSEAEEVYAGLCGVLSELGLEANATKWNVYPTDVAHGVVRSALNDYMAPALGDAASAGTEARDLFGIAIDDPDHGQRELRRALTVLTKRRDDLAVEALQEAPNLIRYAPEYWSRYLCALAKDKAIRKTIDMDWLEECVVSPRSQYADAERLVVMPALAEAQPSKATGRSLLGLARSHGSPRIRVGAAAVWGRAKGWKADHAVEGAVDAPEFGTRRAFALTLADKKIAKLPAAVDKLRAADPELEPTLAYVGA